MEVTTTNETADDARQARAVEYGTYTASEAIHINGVLAFNAGDPVPVGHVEAYGLKGAVQRVGSSDAPSKAASKADWVDYAVAKGKSREDAEAATKDDLVAEFGG